MRPSDRAAADRLINQKPFIMTVHNAIENRFNELSKNHVEQMTVISNSFENDINRFFEVQQSAIVSRFFVEFANNFKSSFIDGHSDDFETYPSFITDVLIGEVEHCFKLMTMPKPPTKMTADNETAWRVFLIRKAVELTDILRRVCRPYDVDGRITDIEYLITFLPKI